MRPIWSTQTITMQMQIRLFGTNIIPITSYACETWKITAKVARKLNAFQQRCLRSILGITYCNHITNEEILQRSSMKILQDIVTEHQLRLAGHILRLPDNRHPKVSMTWTPQKGKRKQGRSVKTWRRTFQKDLKFINIKWHDMDTAANDRQTWRKLIAQCARQHRQNQV